MTPLNGSSRPRSSHMTALQNQRPIKLPVANRGVSADAFTNFNRCSDTVTPMPDNYNRLLMVASPYFKVTLCDSRIEIKLVDKLDRNTLHPGEPVMYIYIYTYVYIYIWSDHVIGTKVVTSGG